MVCLHVDDMLIVSSDDMFIVSSDDMMVASTTNMLNSRFNMKDLGLVDVILGIKIKRK